MKRHVYEYDEVVIGSNLSAILYAYVEQKPLLFKDYNPPFFYEHFDVNVPFENLFFTNVENTLRTPQGEIKVGVSKLEIYNRLLFVLSLSGLIPLSNKIQSIRIEDNSLKISTERARLIRIKYNKLRVFNPEMIKGANIEIKKEKKLVHDIFKIKCEKHNYNLLNGDDDFAQTAYFMNNEKKTVSKQVLVVSKLTDEQLNDFDFSIVPLKYKLKKILQKNNIKKRAYESKISLEHTKRSVYNFDTVSLQEEKNIIYDKRTEKQLCQNIVLTTHSRLLGVYPWRLNHLLLDSRGMIR